MAESELIFFECGYCNIKVQADEHGRTDYYDGDTMQGPVEWVLVKCTNCKMPNVVGREYYGSDGQRDFWDEWRIYPPRARTFTSEVPKAIRTSYDEAQVNLRSRSFLSTALMCRRTVELLAKDQGASGRDLAAKLENLKNGGTIDGRLYEWATQLRFAGNDAAHADDPQYDITKDDADDLMSFTEAIIDYVYIYRARFDEFMARRPARPAKATTKKPSTGKKKKP